METKKKYLLIAFCIMILTMLAPSVFVEYDHYVGGIPENSRTIISGLYGFGFFFHNLCVIITGMIISFIIVIVVLYNDLEDIDKLLNKKYPKEEH